MRSDSNADVLVLAVEDYSGNSALPPYDDTTQPELPVVLHGRAGDTPHDVYDYDAEDRKAPDPLGVLSHFDAVIWYTGNDNVTRVGPTPGVADLEAHRTITAVRDFVNEGGRVALQGVNAGRQYDLVEYPQEGFPPRQCDGDLQTTDDGKCQPLSNDFAQYYLGSYVRADGGGLDADGNMLPGHGSDCAAGRLERDAERSGRAREQPLVRRDRDGHAPGHVEHPRPGDVPAVRQRAGRGLGDRGRQAVRPALGRVVHDLSEHQRGVQAPAQDDRPCPSGRYGGPVVLHLLQHGAGLGLRVRGGADAQRAGRGQRRLGHAARRRPGHHTSNDTGASCPSGWSEELHHHLQHYTTFNPAGAGSCTPTGTTGDWNAASGNSGGWQEWKIDLSAYQGKRVEISIVYATDWGTLTVPGMLVDDTKVTVNGATTHETDFETDQGGWEIPGAHPAGPSSNLNDWIRSQRIFEDAAVTKSAFGLMFGFGLEGVNGEENRRDLMERTLSYLLAD